ncbi:MAG: tetratricopeptide (TPR) repeat protein [Planctomycetota bacterium]|jgi:tetratricopeptide (TPR) repeat protein
MKPLMWCLTIGFLFTFAAPLPASVEGDKVKKGLAMMKVGDYEGALAKFRDAQIDHPSSNELHFNIGMALYKLDRFEDARGAFESAVFSRNAEIEKKAIFHIGNCFIKEGKLEQALDHLNRALQVDEDYQVAKVNREYVVRKMKELARKQKQQQKKQEQERQIIEKLQALLEKQVQLHAGLRWTMKTKGQDIQPTHVDEYAAIFDADAPPEFVEGAKAKSLDEVIAVVGTEQDKLLTELRGILEEVAKKLEASDTTKQPAGGAPQQPDPEAQKLTKALPHLQDAEPKMVRAVEAAKEELNFAGAHAAQESALLDLLAAMNALLDELAKLIKEEAMLLTDSYATLTATKEGDEAKRPTSESLARTGASHQETQGLLRQRTEQFSKGLEQHLTSLKTKLEEKMAPGGQGVQPGEDPQEGLRKVESALTHVNAAAGFMEEAEPLLGDANFEDAVPKEKSALDSLIKARAALSPPQQQQGGEGDDKKDGQKQENQDEGDENKKDKEKEEGKEGEQAKPSEGDGKDEKDQKKGEAMELSDEQAKKTLDQQKQREMDRRREQKDKMKKARRGKSKGVKKDW